MLNQDKMIIIEPPPDAGFFTRYRFWREQRTVERSLRGLPDVLQPSEELYLVVGGKIDRGSLNTAMQSLGMAGGGSSSSFVNKLPGLLTLVPIIIAFMLTEAFSSIPFIGGPLTALLWLAAIAGAVCVGFWLLPFYGSAIAATSTRVMYVKKPLVGIEVRDFTYSQISSVSQDSGAFYATITIQLAGSGIQFTEIIKEKASPLLNAIRDNIGRAQSVSLDASSIEALANIANAKSAIDSTESRASLSVGSGVSNLDALEKLADLRDRGILSDSEFEDEKAKILGGGD